MAKTTTSSSGKAASARKAPWKRSNPRKRAGKASKHLTPAKKAAAKASAKRAGRPYPNLVDNMRAAKSAKTPTGATSKRKTPNKKATKKAAGKKTDKKTAKKAGPKTSKKAGRTAR